MLASFSALAADTKGQFSLHGLGAHTCGQFVDEVKKNDVNTNDMMLTWLMGYLTARNRVDKDTYDTVPALPGDVLLQMLYSVCEKSPDARVEPAVNALIKGIAPARLTAESPLITVQAGDAKLELRRQTFVAIQEALIKKKVYKGPVESTLTPALQAALKAYQKDQKLKETGLPDAGTVVRLLIMSANDKAK